MFGPRVTVWTEGVDEVPAQHVDLILGTVYRVEDVETLLKSSRVVRLEADESLFVSLVPVYISLREFCEIFTALGCVIERNTEVSQRLASTFTEILNFIASPPYLLRQSSRQPGTRQ